MAKAISLPCKFLGLARASTPSHTLHSSSSVSSSSSSYPIISLTTSALINPKTKSLLSKKLEKPNPRRVFDGFVVGRVAVISFSVALSLVFGSTAHGLEDGVRINGASVFNRSCIGCHDGGGNVLQPGATLFSVDLERNGVATEEEIYRVTYSGKGRMPGFGEECTPRGQCTFGPRLKDEEIRLLAQFVQLQAQQGWPNTD